MLKLPVDLFKCYQIQSWSLERWKDTDNGSLLVLKCFEKSGSQHFLSLQKIASNSVEIIEDIIRQFSPPLNSLLPALSVE